MTTFVSSAASVYADTTEIFSPTTPTALGSTPVTQTTLVSKQEVLDSILPTFTNNSDREVVKKTIDTISPKLLTAQRFEAFKTLSKDMNLGDHQELANFILETKSTRFTQEYLSFVETFSENLDSFKKLSLAKNTISIDFTKFTPSHIQAVQTLSKEYWDIPEIAKAVAKISSEDFTPELIFLVDDLCKNLFSSSRIELLERVICLDIPTLTPVHIKAIKTLAANNSSSHDIIKIIRVISDFSSEDLTPEFISLVQTLSKGLYEFEKVDIISAFSSVKVANLSEETKKMLIKTCEDKKSWEKVEYIKNLNS